jgi:RsiW-degrading membrane proteinase PrsW (M82 family)
MDNLTDRNWVALLILGVFLVSTATLWFRFRLQTSMRPWLLRHLIGNFILAIGLFTAWFLDAPFFYYLLVVMGVFAMWMWGNRKLREAVPKNR